MKFDIPTILDYVRQGEQLLGTEVGRAVLGAIRDRLSAQLSPEQLAQLQAHDGELAALEQQSRQQAGEA